MGKLAGKEISMPWDHTDITVNVCRAGTRDLCGGIHETVHGLLFISLLMDA